MNTTNLFVELIVIGLGAFIWLSLFFAPLFGFSGFHQFFDFFENKNATLIALASIPFIYVLGIIVDRVADIMLQPVEQKIRGQYFENTKEVMDAKTAIYYKSQIISNVMEYNRSRLRICRGWFLNSLVFIISGNLVLILTSTTHKGLYVLLNTIFFLFFAWLNFYAWKVMTRKEYEKIQSYSTSLKRHT